LQSNKKIPRLTSILIGGVIVGSFGGVLGYMAGLAKEGAMAGFTLGWIVGEIFSIGARDADSNQDL